MKHKTCCLKINNDMYRLLQLMKRDENRKWIEHTNQNQTRVGNHTMQGNYGIRWMQAVCLLYETREYAASVCVNEYANAPSSRHLFLLSPNFSFQFWNLMNEFSIWMWRMGQWNRILAEQTDTSRDFPFFLSFIFSSFFLNICNPKLKLPKEILGLTKCV